VQGDVQDMQDQAASLANGVVSSAHTATTSLEHI
jgi:hypothetical protein